LSQAGRQAGRQAGSVPAGPDDAVLYGITDVRKHNRHKRRSVRWSVGKHNCQETQGFRSEYY